MIEALIGLVVGILIGWAWRATTPASQIIDRYVQKDQRHYERWQAMCQLLGTHPTIKAPPTWRILRPKRPKARSIFGPRRVA